MNENKTFRKATLDDLDFELRLRQRDRKEIMWQTKDGSLIPLNDMSEAHLNNAIRLLLKNFDDLENADFDI